MSTLLLARSFPPIVGGIERYISELFRRLPEPVVVVAPGRARAAAFDSAFPHPVRRYWLPEFGSGGKLPLAPLAVRALTVLPRAKPRIVVSEQVQTAAVGIPLARLLGVPHVVFAYGMELSSQRMAAMKRWAFRSSNRILAISHFAAQTVQRLYEIDGDAIRLIPPAIEPERFARDPAMPRWPDRSAGPVLLTLGRLDPTQRYKGYDRVIRLCAALRDEFPFLRLIIGGSGPDRPWLEQQAAELGIRDRVEFRGYVPDEKLPAVFAEADLFVLASGDAEPSSLRVEGFGIVLAEAAAAGLPSLAYGVGGVADVVSSGTTGLLIEPNETALLVGARALLHDHERRHQMAHAAARHANKCLTWERSVAAMQQTLHELGPDSPHLVADDYRTSTGKNRTISAG